MTQALAFPLVQIAAHSVRLVSRRMCCIVIGLVALSPSASAKPATSDAEQVRLVQTMADRLRARIDELPVLIPAQAPLAKVHEATVTLNRNPVIVDGQRFDGVVITAPATKANFGWAFACPTNTSRWYVFRDRGDMKGFSNFIRRPRAKLAAAAADLKPADVPNLTFQKLDAIALSPGERYVLWFNFSDVTPAEFSVRAGFFAGALTNEKLPALLFPADAANAKAPGSSSAK